MALLVSPLTASAMMASRLIIGAAYQIFGACLEIVGNIVHACHDVLLKSQDLADNLQRCRGVT
jgi:hypothetical protein